MSSEKGRVCVAMSGGIDSSVAAALLKEQGADVFGLTAKTWPRGSRCCADEDIAAARRVAAWLGIPHFVVDVCDLFADRVVRYFADEYAAGRTPSPCVVCNRFIKFGALLEKAGALGAGALATGHYARVRGDAQSGWRLMAGADGRKDQSYFLFDLRQEQLARALFPVGDLTKDDVRQAARRLGVPIHDRGESQDLCFVAPGEHARLAGELRPDAQRRGRIVDTRGREVGQHDGVHHFTVGQRRGLGVAAGRRVYVVSIDAGSGTVVVGERKDLMSRGLVAGGLNWIPSMPEGASFRAEVMIRYNQRATPATVFLLADETVRVDFDEPQFGVTPGQAVVFYRGDDVAGGGWIVRGERGEAG